LGQWALHLAPCATHLLGDDLHCHQPFCHQVLCPLLFACLLSSHSTLYGWVADCERNGAIATLIVLAYLPHTGLDLLDRRYRAVRAQLPSQLTSSERLRALAQCIPCASWEQLLVFARASSPHPARPEPSRTGVGQNWNCWRLDRVLPPGSITMSCQARSTHGGP
jgi:hypothetical protein